MNTFMRILPIARGIVTAVGVAVCGYVLADNNWLDSRVLFPVVIIVFLLSSGSSWSQLSMQSGLHRDYHPPSAGSRNRQTRR